ncbi:HepT-like ribonuclease domain-containing protein [Bifidobacterium sp. SO4]|uniref:HepT-like ribonuclease domain-containing protein n=1 Tax=Bifidobacterium sp. SO4 TaxID=2809030 RepID=UPI001BDD199D|nr:HepT-like ribonuclease domain-containing protein [Bifidobacterium sp. SO4]MBT1171148.1 DUF86 domain-containing protein [Bifidobacterium sp. SO4]
MSEKRSANDPQRDLIHLLQIRHELELAQSFLKGVSLEQFEDDELRQHAVSMAVAQVGEHVKKLSKQFVADQPEVAWKAIAGTRDWIVHDYGNLDFEEIYRSVTTEADAIIAIVSKNIELIGMPDTSTAVSAAQVLKDARGI